MNEQKNIEREVEQILQRLENHEEIWENPFFYAKVKARIEATHPSAQRTFWDLLAGIVRSPVFWLIIFLMNMTTILYISDKLKPSSTLAQEMDSFGRVYDLTQPSTQVITINISNAYKQK